MSKIQNDKYYTPPKLAEELTTRTLNIIGRTNVSEIIEPSAGNGSFHNLFKVYKAYDIEPDSPYVTKQDYLTLDEEYKNGRLYLGNPPFGDRNNLSLKFLKKNVLYGDYIAYIQPISAFGGSMQFYEFDLIHSEDLGVVEYINGMDITKTVKLRCCFNIWKRPSNGKLNSKPNYKLDSIIIKEYRRDGLTHKITPDFDYAMCNWGTGSFGKIPEYIGQYAQEVYFYLKDKNKLDELKSLLDYNNIRNNIKNISMKKMSVIRIYKLLKDNGFT